MGRVGGKVNANLRKTDNLFAQMGVVWVYEGLLL